MGLAARERLAGLARWLSPDGEPAPTNAPLPARSWEWAVLLAILVVAWYVRFHDLSTFPSGFHGDEAVAGLEGQRILTDGWIGPYSPGALGQPTGPLYLTALSIRLFGDTIFAVRFVPALMGLLTVAAWYVVLRRNLGPTVALVGAGLLAVLGWHIHFARIGFPLETWPLTIVLATGALMEALRGGRTVWWAAAGAFAGLGIHAYNAHPLFLAALGLFVVQRVYGWRPVAALAALAGYVVAPNALWLAALVFGILGVLTSRRLASAERFARLSALGVALAIAVLPMVRFAADQNSGYFDHLRLTSVVNKEEWTSLEGTVARSRFLGDRYVDFWDQLVREPRLDGADATGVAPVVPWATLALAGIGVVVGSLRRRRDALVMLGAVVVVVMPLAAVLSVDGVARRTFAMAPFLALLGAVGAVGLVRLGWRRGPLAGGLAVATMTALVGWSANQNLTGEFSTLRGSSAEAWVFAREMTEAAAFMDELPPGSHVYFYSDRWSVNYETRQYLAPDVGAEDRSVKFGEDRFKEFGEHNFVIDPRAGEPVFVFLDTYLDRVAEVRRLYPGGEVVEGALLAGRPTFVAYAPPARIVIDEVSCQRTVGR